MFPSAKRPSPPRHSKVAKVELFNTGAPSRWDDQAVKPRNTYDNTIWPARNESQAHRTTMYVSSRYTVPLMTFPAGAVRILGSKAIHSVARLASRVAKMTYMFDKATALLLK